MLHGSNFLNPVGCLKALISVVRITERYFITSGIADLAYRLLNRNPICPFPEDHIFLINLLMWFSEKREQEWAFGGSEYWSVFGSDLVALSVSWPGKSRRASLECRQMHLGSLLCFSIPPTEKATSFPGHLVIKASVSVPSSAGGRPFHPSSQLL